MRDVSPVPQLPARDVVFLPGDPRLAAVRRQRNREEIVGNTARPLIIVLGFGVELQHDTRRHLHRRGVDLDDLAARVRRDEARDVDVLAVVRHGDPARPRTDLGLADDVAGLRIQLQQLPDRGQRDVGGVAGRTHGDAHGLRCIGQAKAALDDETIRIDDGHGVVVLVDDPELPVRRQRQRLGPAVDGELGDLLQCARVDRRDRVVVLVDRVDAVPRRVVHDRRRRRRALRGQRMVNEVLKVSATRVAPGVGNEDLHADQAGRREGVRHLRAPDLGRVLTERPLVRERAAGARDLRGERVRFPDDGRAGVRHVDREPVGGHRPQ